MLALLFQAEKEELEENLEQLKRQLLDIKLEKSEVEEKLSRLTETSMVRTINVEGATEEDLLQKIEGLLTELNE